MSVVRGRRVEEATQLDSGGRVLLDEELVGAAIAGDDNAFYDLVSRHRHTAVRVAAGIVGANRAEDVVQDALLLAYKALPSIQDRSKFSRWLATITRFRALRFGRSESRHVSGHVSLDETLLETLSDLACAPRDSEPGDDLLIAALDRIPPDYAEVIRLHFLHGMPHQKISEFLDVPVSTVKWRCFRGKELLRCVITEAPAGVLTRCDRSAACIEHPRPLGFVAREGEDPCPGCTGARQAACAAPSPKKRAKGTLPALALLAAAVLTIGAPHDVIRASLDRFSAPKIRHGVSRHVESASPAELVESASPDLSRAMPA